LRALARKTEGVYRLGAERGMAEMPEKFRAAGGDLYVSESGAKRETID